MALSLTSAARVASRFAARPIRVNRGLVQATAETLIKELRKWSRRNREPFEPIGVELRQPLASHKVRMEDVAGQRLTIDIHFLAKNSANPQYIVGAGAGNDRRTGNPVIIVFLNAKDKARQFTDEHSSFPEVLRNTLFHELTHVADTFAKEVQYEGGTKKMVDGDPEMDWDAYYNDPQEVRAFMREIYEQVRERDLGKFFQVFGQTKGLIYALKGTDWSKINEHLTERNRKLMLKGIVTALQDEGLIP